MHVWSIFKGFCKIYLIYLKLSNFVDAHGQAERSSLFQKSSQVPLIGSIPLDAWKSIVHWPTTSQVILLKN